MQKLITFLKIAWVELKKVTWPGKKEIIASTLIVLIMSLLLMFYIGLIDFLLAKAVGFIFR